MEETFSSVVSLERRLGTTWPNLRAARLLASNKKELLRQRLAGLDSPDTSIVVSGSLARDEFTSGSDIDWTLLIDGEADPRHYDLALEIKTVVDELAAKPTGSEGTFGAMVFSHDLIHEIGGEDDSNRNTTRRLLLLLESAVVGREDAYRRVVRNILNRYLLEDRGFWKGSQYRVPRFLQNDFARYWRTMTVDFAYKLRRRSRKGWAIRNLKLRMSRKLIYVSGLLACYGCHSDFSAEEWSEISQSPDRQAQVVEYYRRVFRLTPLDLLSTVLLRYQWLDEAASQILGSYDQFLGMLADNGVREHLEKLEEDEADRDSTYQQARKVSHQYRDGLLTLFFDTESGLEVLTKNYGVF